MTRLVLCLLAAVSASGSVSSKQLAGAPAIDDSVERGVYLWTADNALHVRFAARGAPVLFAGSLAAERKLPALVRTNAKGGGYVQASDENTVVFSTTVMDGTDGFDLPLFGGGATFDLMLDGAPVEPKLVVLGAERHSPGKLPLRLPL